jgi:DNA-binding Xre family transcriptional regulator
MSIRKPLSKLAVKKKFGKKKKKRRRGLEESKVRFI